MNFTFYTLHFTFAFAALAANASPLLLAPPKYGDPTRMTAMSRNGLSDVATAYLADDRADSWTMLCWMRWDPRPSLTATNFAPFVTVLASADAALATTEGGDTLSNCCSHAYATPLALTGGTWCETCLPQYDAQGVDGWEYGVWCVNVETDSDLTLTVAGAERSVAAGTGRRIFNVAGETSSRAVAVSAADAGATVRLGVAANPLVQFVGSQFDAQGAYASLRQGGEIGGLWHDEWRLVVARARIETNCLAVAVCGYGATAKFECEKTVVQELAHPRATFARHARIRVGVASALGMGYGEAVPDGVRVYGFRCYRGWLGDALVERMRDQDVAEMQRRGMW